MLPRQLAHTTSPGQRARRTAATPPSAVHATNSSSSPVPSYPNVCTPSSAPFTSFTSRSKSRPANSDSSTRIASSKKSTTPSTSASSSSNAQAPAPGTHPRHPRRLGSPPLRNRPCHYREPIHTAGPTQQPPAAPQPQPLADAASMQGISRLFGSSSGGGSRGGGQQPTGQDRLVNYLVRGAGRFHDAAVLRCVGVRFMVCWGQVDDAGFRVLSWCVRTGC